MKMKIMKSAVLSVAFASVITLTSGSVFAQEAKTLDQLLDFVKQGQTSEARENRAREAKFKSAKNQQAKLLAEAKQMRANEEARSTRLEANFEQNELI